MVLLLFVQDDKGEGELDDQGADHDARVYGPPVRRERERNGEQSYHAAYTPQDLHTSPPL
jgi:hypothetical protein